MRSARCAARAFESSGAVRYADSSRATLSPTKVSLDQFWHGALAENHVREAEPLELHETAAYGVGDGLEAVDDDLGDPHEGGLEGRRARGHRGGVGMAEDVAVLARHPSDGRARVGRLQGFGQPLRPRHQDDGPGMLPGRPAAPPP